MEQILYIMIVFMEECPNWVKNVVDLKSLGQNVSTYSQGPFTANFFNLNGKIVLLAFLQFQREAMNFLKTQSRENITNWANF